MNNYSIAERINTEVNASVSYMTDAQQYARPEFWEPAGKYGDCEDFALAKRGKLLSQGFDESALHLALCWVETGEYHCVLLAETDQGLFALDNRYPNPMPPKDLPYKWDKALRGSEWYAISF